MAEKEETKKPEGDNNKKDDDDKPEFVVKNGKTYRKIKPVPRLKEMLQNGAPGEIPYDKKDLKGKMMHLLTGPVALAVVFLISLAIWHHAPHGQSTHPGYKLPGFSADGATGFELLKKMQQAQREHFLENDKKMASQVEEARKRAEKEF
jgi:hypothetical protein